MKLTKRFVDTGKQLSAFADEVLVICVKCGSPGTVHATWIPYKWNATFKCSSCDLQLDSAESHWVGATRLSGRQPCGHCGYKWLTPFIDYETLPENPPSQIDAICPQCSHQTKVTASLYRAHSNDQGDDHHFGLPLRLVVNTRHGTVWAYNKRHLNELSDYISAKLRERRDAGNRAMFSRLPKWMKVAKHREDLANALRKLDAMA